ncbi:MAG: c-type cytochrome biogenesis protein CcmI [Gammaproteobacteria bacterium]|nr:c-type cytochrome biogenesis protein CcmI [Gammaproteobacteria bacterium]
MTVFWIVAACFIIAALLFVLPPLLQRSDKEKKEATERRAINTSIYRDQLVELETDLRNDMVQPELYAQGRRELEQRLLEDVETEQSATSPPASAAKQGASGIGRITAAVIGIAVPVFAVLLYFKLGNPDVLSPEAMAKVQAAATAEQHADDPAKIEMMIGRLIERLKQNPQDAEGWTVLGRSLYALARHDEATEAFSRAAALAPNDAQLLADYADSMAMANGERLDERSVALIKRAIQADPNNQKALWLAGTAEFEAGNFTAAVGYWERLLKLLPPGSEVANTMASNIEEARGLASGRPPSAQAAPAAAGVAGATVGGVVNLAPALAGKIAPGDTVFIFARAAQGPRMPLAIMRAQAKDLPLQFSLDDSMAAMPTMKLSNASEVIVSARVSKSGNAMPQPGDLQGDSQAVKVGASGVKVVIDSVVP